MKVEFIALREVVEHHSKNEAELSNVINHGEMDPPPFCSFLPPLRSPEFYYTEQPTAVMLKKKYITKSHVLITTYEVVLKDAAVISRIKWRTLIVDKAHRLKNPKARLF